MNDEYLTVRANNVNRFLDSTEWKEAWEAYRARLLAEIEATDDIAYVERCKALLKAAIEARKHLEKIVNEGKLAAHAIELERKRSFLQKLRLY